MKTPEPSTPEQGTYKRAVFFAIFSLLVYVVWFVQWPFKDHSSNPLSLKDHQRGCLEEIGRQLGNRKLTVETGPQAQWKPDRSGAFWSGKVQMMTPDDTVKEQFFSCEVQGNDPYLARVKVVLPPR